MVKGYDITPELAIAAYNTLIQFCRQQEGIENNLKLRSVGETMTVSKERAEYLAHMKVAEIIDSKGGDPESPIEAQG